jgi:hypothetical protein
MMHLFRSVEDGAPDEAEIMGSRPTFGPLFGFWDNVMGKGCQPMGLPMLRPTLWFSAYGLVHKPYAH